MVAALLVLLLVVALVVAAVDAVPSPAPVQLTRRAGAQPEAWYREQAALSEAHLEADAGDAEAWYSLFLATEYGGADGSRQVRAQILARMARRVPDSWQLPYLRARLAVDRAERVADLEEALRRGPDRGEVLEDLAVERELDGDAAAAMDLWRRLYGVAALPRGLLDYGYNLLQSVDDGGVLLTGGDNDTFPAWLLQRVHGVRTDVAVVSLGLAGADRVHLARRLAAHGVTIGAEALPHADEAAFLRDLCAAIAAASPTTPVFVSLTVGAEVRQPIAGRLRLTGLAARVAPLGASPADVVDARRALARNLQDRFRLDGLWHDWYDETHVSAPVVRRLAANYAYPALLLAETCQAAGDRTAAQRWRDLAVHVARESGDGHLLGQVLARVPAP